ncbi:MAG: hypothetical protein KDA72_15150 [Planctomycetales bacterium]|nr:hypothetical protein [Planctomycetales bacterium]
MRFLALCKAIGIPARLHFSLVSKQIQRGFFTGWSYWLVPNELSQAWIEVWVDDKWHRIDVFINDKELHWTSMEGAPFPLGATYVEEDHAFNFAIHSKHA